MPSRRPTQFLAIAGIPYSPAVLRDLRSELFGIGSIGRIAFLPLGRKSTKRALQLGQSGGKINRLADVIVGPKVKRKLDILSRALPAYHDDRQVGLRVGHANYFQYLDAVDLGHNNVKQHGSETLLLDHAQRRHATVRLSDLEAAGAEVSAQQVPIFCDVVDDEQFTVITICSVHANAEPVA